MVQRTLAIVKPDAVAAGKVGPIVAAIEESGLKIAALKMVHLTREAAEGFYHVHRERPFFESLTVFMSEGPIVVMVLGGDEAIQRWRDLMGATDPGKAAEGSLRKRFGRSIERNATHGSDAPDTAAFEVGYFFNNLEIFPA